MEKVAGTKVSVGTKYRGFDLVIYLLCMTNERYKECEYEKKFRYSKMFLKTFN
jgi:hypothetical protein